MARLIITGSSRGIGFELVQLLATAGHEVLALSRNATPVLSLKLPGVRAFSFDICKPEDHHRLEEFLQDWEQVDVLVNNAGRVLNKPFEKTSTEEFRRVYEVNVFGLAALSKVVIPKMTKDGHVLNITSMGGVQGSHKFAGLAAYSSSKGAVITLTEMLAEEYREKGPKFNALALGAVQTEMLQEAFPGYRAPVTAREMAVYIMDFALHGHRLYNGKVLPVSTSTP